MKTANFFISMGLAVALVAFPWLVHLANAQLALIQARTFIKRARGPWAGRGGMG
jgi:hypothetical protein